MALYPTPDPVLLPHVLPQLTAGRTACRQRRTADRLTALSLGAMCALGRHTLSQLIVALGAGELDWSAWYRLFATPDRLDTDRLATQVVEAVRADLAVDAPFPVVIDATHLPRSSQRMPGTSWARCPRNPAWKPGIHRAQRWVGLNAVLPRSAEGDSRAVPLRWVPAPPPSAVPLAGHPALKEWEAAIAQLTWLRTTLDQQQDARRILAVADGAYSSADLWKALPERVTMLARCAKNRALYALPDPPPPGKKGRRRVYGDRLPTPQQMLADRRGWRTVALLVRGRRRTMRVKVRGPLLVRPAGTVPLYLLVVPGVKASPSHRTRKPASWLVNARQDQDGAWVLPDPVEALLGWAWQRWEVEILHRELKSGFGLGQQQAWSATGTVATTQWLCWVYAVVVLAGYRAWGYVPPPGASPGRWWTPRRWSLGALWQQVRVELWQVAEFRPGWSRSPDTWAEMTAWIATRTSAVRGYRRI